MRKDKAEFQKLIRRLGGCGCQDGHPCNTCFHTNISDELGLSDDATHLLWMIHLMLRNGKEYTEESVFKANKEFFKGLAER